MLTEEDRTLIDIAKKAAAKAIKKHQSKFKRPKKVWVCVDCETVSDYKTSGKYHCGHVGTVGTPTAEFFRLREPKKLEDGEVVFVLKTNKER
jgi:hypothetical protein